jgi:hypothetical protein
MNMKNAAESIDHRESSGDYGEKRASALTDWDAGRQTLGRSSRNIQILPSLFAFWRRIPESVQATGGKERKQELLLNAAAYCGCKDS